MSEPEVRDHVDEILLAWANLRPELDPSSIGVIGRVLRAARLLTREIETELGRFGLGTAEFNALSALRRQDPPYELTPTEVSEALLFTSGGLTKLLERLERAELVIRVPDENDRRGVRVILTRKGEEVHEAAMRAHLENQERLIASLGPEEREAIAAGLKKLLISLDIDWHRRQGSASVHGGRSAAKDDA